MIGYYIVPESSQSIKKVDSIGFVSVFPITYIGGCCMGITAMVPPMYPRVEVLIPYKSTDESSTSTVNLTLEEITSWVNYINELGFKCEITNTNYIRYIDYKNSGVFCMVTFSAPEKGVSNKYNLIVLTLLRYMFNTQFKYREVYLNAVKINNLLPDIDPVVRLSLAHKLVMTNIANNNSLRTSMNTYSGYYGLFKHAYNTRFLTSKSLNLRLKNVDNGVNNVFTCFNPVGNGNSEELLPSNLYKLVNNPTEENLTILRDIINRNLD